MKTSVVLSSVVLSCALALCPAVLFAAGDAYTNEIANLGSVTVEATALSKYRPENVFGGTFTDVPPEKLPMVVDSLTEDFIREKNPTDMNDLLRWVPGIETGGTSLLVRQPGLFSVRGMGGTEPAFDGVVPVGRGAGLFMDPFMMDSVEVAKGPIASLAGGSGAQQNNNGAGGSINMYLKSAHIRESEVNFQENTSVGRNIWRQRAMVDVNEVVSADKFALRVPAAFDIYSPAYVSGGSQNGARPREQYTVAPSFLAKPSDDVAFGLKTMFIYSDSPSYIGIPVWRGKPAAGYGWYESSARKDDRSMYKGLMVNPWVDWQVTEEWLLKFGGSFMYSHMEQTTREPYVGANFNPITGTGNPLYPLELTRFFQTGWWDSGNKYMTSNFSESRMFQQSYNAYARSIYTLEDLPYGFKNAFLVQPDFYYRESSSGFGGPVSRYGATVQDSLGWEWFTLLAGIRYDYFVEPKNFQTTVNRITGVKTTTRYDEARAFAFSPRGGLTVNPFDWLVFFGNISQTQTPTLGYRDSNGSRPTDPWTATQWESGFRVRPLEKLWLSASYFNIEQENTPVAETTGGKTFYYFDGHNRSKGVELSVSGDVTDHWTVMSLYSYTLYEDCTKSGTAGEFERFPRHAATFNTSYRLHGFDLVEDIAVGMGYRFRSKSYATMRGAYVNENLYFDQSHVFDVNMSIPFSKFGWRDDWFLTLGVRNVFGEKYFDTSRHYYECFAGEPRTFEIGLRGKF